MILLLGKSEHVREYAENELGTYEKYVPSIMAHYSEYDNAINKLRGKNIPVITSQNIEFIDYLLFSDLNFDVWTVFDDMTVRKLSKRKAIEARAEMGIELRG